MGVDSERFVHAVPQDSYCFLCNTVLENPVEIVECGHFFCHQCLEKWKENNILEQQQPDEHDVDFPASSSSCPYCGIDIDFGRVRKSKLIWNLIQNMNVYCRHKNNGCEVVYKYGFDDLHREKCVYEQLTKIENNNNETTAEMKELEARKCPTCRNSLGENINSHDCLKELTMKVKEQASIITNLDHENNRLMFKLSTCEKQYLDERTEVESQFYLESLKYNKEIRDLRTRVANLQGELAVISGQSDISEIIVDIERIQGSLGFNIIGGTSKVNGEASGGIFVSRIVEGGAADQPGKLKLHDQILEVDGIDLREATHELAVNTFRSSGDPVKMVVRRSVRKALTSGGVTAQVDFVATKENNVAADVVLRAEKNKLNKEYSSSNGNVRREKNSNRRGWFSPEEISGSPAEDLSSSCNEVFVADHLSEQNTAKNSGGDKEEYDSAYDTLMTNKSSRCSHHSSTVADVSSDVESTSTERTLEAVDDKEGVQQRKQYSPLRQQQREQRDSARENSSDSCEKRRSTFFIIPESGAGGSVGVGGDNKTTTASLEDFNGSTGVPDDDFDYEYEEVVLKKTAGKFGVLLCYGGGDSDVAVYVGDVEENSAADINGKIMVGDQIVQINHCHVTNVEDAYRMFEENAEITLIVARTMYDVPSEFYDEAEETDLDMLDCIAEESESHFESKTSSPTYASSVSSDTKSPTHKITDNAMLTKGRPSIVRSRSKTLSPVDTNLTDEFKVRQRERSSSNDEEMQRKRLPSASSTDTKLEKEPKKNSLKNFVKNKLGGQKDKRTGSHSDDSCEFNKLPRCDSNSSTNSNKSQKSKDSSGVSKAKSTAQDILQAKLKEQRQQSKLKAYMDSPSLNHNRHRVNTNVSLFQAPYMINNTSAMPFHYQNVANVVPVAFHQNRPSLTPTPPMNALLAHRNSMTASVSSLRSAMKNSQMNRPEQRTAKRVQIDPHPDWNNTEKRVWEEFKIIQSMEKENNNSENNKTLDGQNIEAEWRVRRSKDGKHVYIKKTNTSRNKILKERAQQINDERCGITTDDDAFTVYQGQYWNREQRKKQLNRHNERRKKLVQKAELKASYENTREKEMAEAMQRNTLPVFDNFITIEEILSQRNRSGIRGGPIHVTTI